MEVANLSVTPVDYTTSCTRLVEVVSFPKGYHGMIMTVGMLEGLTRNGAQNTYYKISRATSGNTKSLIWDAIHHNFTHWSKQPLRGVTLDRDRFDKPRFFILLVCRLQRSRQTPITNDTLSLIFLMQLLISGRKTADNEEGRDSNKESEDVHKGQEAEG